jgi:hypothetical protein
MVDGVRTTAGDRDADGAVVKRRIAPCEESAAFSHRPYLRLSGVGDALVGIVDTAAGDHGSTMNGPVELCAQTLVRQQRRQRMVSHCMK